MEKREKMSSKENILKRLAATAMPEFAYPEFNFTPQHFDNAVEVFAQRLEAGGGKFVQMHPGESLDDVIRRCYPQARTIASPLEEVTLATLHPDQVEDPRQLVDIDLGVVAGHFGVAENGAVWITQDTRHKALYFGTTALIIVIPQGAVVSTMHEATLRPETENFGYGCYISGPSKTADIEQALVFGAHGPMSVTVVMRN